MVVQQFFKYQVGLYFAVLGAAREICNFKHFLIYSNAHHKQISLTYADSNSYSSIHTIAHYIMGWLLLKRVFLVFTDPSVQLFD